MLGEREGGIEDRERERERVKENAGTCMGGGVFGQQCEARVCTLSPTMKCV